MAIDRARAALGQVFFKRCFYLFIGDIVPLLRRVRALCVLEQLTGALFLAILIARLAGVYPPSALRQPGDEEAVPAFIRRLRERTRSGPPQ